MQLQQLDIADRAEGTTKATNQVAALAKCFLHGKLSRNTQAPRKVGLGPDLSLTRKPNQLS